jgi:hypothetical protein
MVCVAAVKQNRSWREAHLSRHVYLMFLASVMTARQQVSIMIHQQMQKAASANLAQRLGIAKLVRKHSDELTQAPRSRRAHTFSAHLLVRSGFSWNWFPCGVMFTQ